MFQYKRDLFQCKREVFRLAEELFQYEFTLYKTEIGESQNATKQKDKSLKELEYWVCDFKQVNKIALEDQPQLLEVLGYYVTS